MKGQPVFGCAVGNGATLNIELGFVPECVHLYNATDGTPYTIAYLSWVVPFTSGGTKEITAGDKIKGATSAATGVVRQVLLYSGTWAGGDAAGFIELLEGSLVGTFGSENVYVDSDSTAGINDATVTANVVHNCAITTAAASATGTSAISRYEGTLGGDAKGFTIGSAIATEAKLLRYAAWRGEQ
ncbi:hypothetical protein ACFFTN_01435 [Aminobacter aganoensis]|uniref:Uncharacterized protein n=1 Tax=Aminobacter aganoensis TaxID=83264 RepID=A0A7X0F5F8_9HYPH|nr:hypothetical protein [Aminobacter aganoensis]MBB6353478.1 hypothetical protein [Aminobacter aganoensis]